MNRVDVPSLVQALQQPNPANGPAAAAGSAAPTGPARADGSFGQLVKGVLESANRDQLEAEKQAIALAEGRGDIVDAMVSLSKADLSLRFVVTLRNRAVEAYREIMNLQL